MGVSVTSTDLDETIHFDPVTDFPPPEKYQPLLNLFFVHLQQYFPCLERSIIDQRLQNGTMSAFLLNCRHHGRTLYLPDAV